MQLAAGRAYSIAGRLGVIAGCLLLANCNTSSKFSGIDPRYGVSSSPRGVAFGERVPKGGGSYRIGKPYVVAGKTYVPEERPDYRAEGMASWYGKDFHGRLTANGEVFDMESISAAHPTLPMPSYARVTNLSNNRSLIVRINDRGPYHDNRVIDLSTKAAQLLGFHGNGIARVRVEYVGRAPLEGSDDRKLVATLREGAPAPAPSNVRLASAKPFAPQSLDADRGGGVPVPPDRPFRLGQDEGDRAALTEMSGRSRDVGRQVAASQPRAAQLASPQPPALAYQPASRNTPTGYMTGRGLY
ncbi:MAG: septal ring lytic transglycosylase RlpA family protein [Pseudorhodoplanes sp.]